MITSETVETDLPDRARTRIGVGERVVLTAKPGPVQWEIVSGTGELSVGDETKADFTAPDSAGEVQISAQGNGCTASMTFTVVAPTGVHLERVDGTRKKHIKNTRSTGMICEMWVEPSDVSFRNVSFRELEAYATGTGEFEQYCRARKIPHAANSYAATIAQVDPGKGSKLSARDRLFVRTATQLVGSIIWSIPWEYLVKSSLFSQRFSNNVDQVATFTADGEVTLTKGGASVSSEFNDPTEKDPEFP